MTKLCVGLQPVCKDPVFSIAHDFAEDPRNDIKVNLGAGAYRDEDGKPWILPAVRKAEKIIIDNPELYDKEYPP